MARRPFRQRLADAAAASTDPAVRAVIVAASPVGTGPLVYRGHA
jgi:hypothetical protein